MSLPPRRSGGSRRRSSSGTGPRVRRSQQGASAVTYGTTLPAPSVPQRGRTSPSLLIRNESSLLNVDASLLAGTVEPAPRPTALHPRPHRFRSLKHAAAFAVVANDVPWHTRRARLPNELNVLLETMGVRVLSPLLEEGKGTRVMLWRLWDQRTMLKTPKGHDAPITAVTCSPDSLLAVSGDASGDLRMFDLARRGVCTVKVTGAHRSKITCLAVIGMKRHVLTGGNDGAIKMWDSDSGRQIRSYEQPSEPGHSAEDPSWLTSMVVLDPTHFVTSTTAGRIRVWNIEQSQALRALISDASGRTWVSAVALMPDGCTIISAEVGIKPCLRVWDLEQPNESALLRTIPFLSSMHDRSCRLAPSPFVPNLVAVGMDGPAIELWNVQDGVKLVHLDAAPPVGATRLQQRPVSGVETLEWLPDGRLVSGTDTWGNELRIWDISERECVRIVKDIVSPFVLVMAPHDTPQFAASDSKPRLRSQDLDAAESEIVRHGHSERNKLKNSRSSKPNKSSSGSCTLS